MISDEAKAAIAVCGVAIFICVVGFTLGYSSATYFERASAVKTGVGRYVVDEKTGATRFVYGVQGASK